MAGTQNTPSVAQHIEAMVSAIRRVVKALTAGRYAMSELSDALESAANRLSRFVGGSRDLKVSELLKLLELIRVPIPLFLDLVRAELPATPPAAILRSLCLPANAPEAPFLKDLQDRLAGAARPSGKGSRAAELEELDDLRFVGALAAKRQLEEVCRELAADCATGDSETLRHELGCGVGLWATISRTLGNKTEAAQALAFALDLAAMQPDPLLIAVLKQRAANLVADFGHLSVALGFLAEATEYFACEGLLGRLATCNLDRGIVLIMKDEWGQAEGALQTARGQLPNVGWRNKVAVFHALATCHERRKDYEGAKSWLAKATAEYGDRKDGLLGQLLWAAGRQAFEAGAPEEANLRLQEAVRLLAELGQPFEAELALLDLIEVRFLRGSSSALRSAGEDLLGRVSQCSHSRIATDAMIALGNELLWGTPTVNDIKKSRAELARAGSLIPPPAFSCR